MHTPQSIVVSGSIAIDRIMGFSGRYLDHIRPEQLSSLSISLLLNKLSDTYGGVGANIAYSLALLGDTPILLGSAGPDAPAYLERLAGQGVDISHVHLSKLPTASFNVITDADENQVGGFYPGAMSDSELLSFEEWKDRDIIAVVSPHDPAAMGRQVAECKRWGLRLCYDVGQQVSNLAATDLVAGLDAAQILILNEYEMGALAAKVGRTSAQICAQIPIVVTTFGKKGCVIDGTQVANPIRVGVVAPERVVDPTGAGDAFRAGFLFGLARAWDLAACAGLGATCATYAIEHSGTQGHSFSLNDVQQRYQTAFGKALPA
jgi:adenosine kinase